MMQGDACNLGIRILNNAGNPITPQDISELEITLGHLRKTASGSQLFFYDGIWFFPITQRESASLHPAPIKAQVRVLWKNGVLEGKPIYGLRIQESISKEVL